MKAGALIRLCRTDAGMSQEELANAAGVNKNTIWKCENNFQDMRFEVLKRVLEATGHIIKVEAKEDE